MAKGSNILTEHYGAVEADVPISDDPSTQVNIGFVESLAQSDIVLLAGQARNFCVKNTLEQVVHNFADPLYAQKIKVLSDCTSGIPGFESLDQDLWDFCKKHSIEVIKSTDFLA